MNVKVGNTYLWTSRFLDGAKFTVLITSIQGRYAVTGKVQKLIKGSTRFGQCQGLDNLIKNKTEIFISVEKLSNWEVPLENK